ncbi:hypothetical protein U5922_013350 [Aquicoccus sp. G2-2]|uniref:hypothetical protein n=1 Tax=Aquicoccus sp. G2-2 TaxID=3092120 RepID=UPI002ADFA7CD|nr:hypothetical protein [Aquicoccus sp. G2-2]MEA1114394.1 hypothetical protein [Aquicoccus sp. G2-2]
MSGPPSIGKACLMAVFAGLANLAALMAHAAPVPVRSGEHDGFTRLVLDLPAPSRWTLSETPDGSQITLKDIEATFDLSDTFRKITTQRIAGLAPVTGQNALAINLNCDCTVDAFLNPPRMLVIDIRDQPTGADTAPPRLSDRPASPPPPRPAYHFPFAPQSGAAGTGQPPSDPPDAPQNMATAPAPDGLSPASQTPHEKAHIYEAERRLTAELSRAVSQGLVTPKQTHLPTPEHTDPKDQGKAATGNATPDHAAARPAPHPDINLRAETSADRDFMRLNGASPHTNTGERCITEETLNVADWAENAPFGAQVGALRARLFGEFDRPDPAAATALAKLYIAFGFGAEALDILTVTKANPKSKAILSAMAEITEYGHGRHIAPFSGQYDCDSPAAFWALLADEHIPANAMLNEAAILRAINALPAHTRELLGPIASARLVALGKTELAAQVLRPVIRGTNTPNSRLDMAKAELHQAKGDLQDASATFAKVVDANTALSPKAVIGLIEARLEGGQAIDIGLADLAGAYAQEYRKSPLWEGLKRAQILALASAGSFEKAFHELALFIPQTSPEIARSVRSKAMGALARGAGDISFLKHALDTGAQGRSDLNAEAGIDVARRLIALGFPETAKSYLHAPAKGRTAHAQRILLARSALALGKPRRAEAALLGLIGADVDLLRARARSQAGDHAGAGRLYAALNQSDDATREAWLGQDWQTLGTSKDEVLRKSANLIAPPAATTPADTGVLATDRALLKESRAARDTLTQMINHFEIEPEKRR